MINLFIASGNLGKDIELRYTPNQKCIGTFSLPVKSGWGDNEKTSWVRCKLLGDRAEKLAPYLIKGVKVSVVGRFEMEEWEKDGIKHSIPCLIVNELDLPPKTALPRDPVVNTRPNALHEKLTPEQLETFDDDVPF